MKLDSSTKPNICPSSVCSTQHISSSFREERTKIPCELLSTEGKSIETGECFYTGGIYLAEGGSSRLLCYLTNLNELWILLRETGGYFRDVLTWNWRRRRIILCLSDPVCCSAIWNSLRPVSCNWAVVSEVMNFSVTQNEGGGGEFLVWAKQTYHVKECFSACSCVRIYLRRKLCVTPLGWVKSHPGFHWYDRVCSVRYELRGKKYLYIGDITLHSTSRWHHCGGWN